MASIKNLKSKGKAVMFDPLDREYSAEYALRKQQFADTQPAKIVRPLRAVRRRYEQALQLWDRSIVKSTAQVPYPYGEEQLYLSANCAAKRGDGAIVRFLAT